MPVLDVDPSIALHHYDIAPARAIEPAGGTAGRTWKVITDSADYFLRLRGVRTSSEQRLAFDHGLRDHLVANHVPTAATLPSKSGDRWLRLDEGVFELYPFVVGRLFDPGQMDEIAAAGSALARYHRAASAFTPPHPEPERIAQYTTLGFYDRVSDRMDDPELQRLNAERARELALSETERATADWVLERLESMSRTYAGEA
jgi:Ser/Thr protein kinase RdoA (MazF antagonist)